MLFPMDLRRQLACFALALLLAPAALAGSQAAPVPPTEEPAPYGWSLVAVLHNGFTIRHESRESVGELTRLHLGGERGYLELDSADIARFDREPLPPPPAPAAPAAADVHALIAAAARRHGIDADLIASVIAAESGFDARAVSHKGARGLMQLMPATAAELGLRLEDIFDPAANIDAGVRYLAALLTLYRDDLARALAAYNAGPHRVAQHNGVPPYRETRAYVARVIRDFNRRKLAQRAAPNVASAHLAAASGAGQ